MKTKDIIYLVITVVIFAVGGYLAFNNLVPKSTAGSAGTKVEIVGALKPDLDYAVIDTLLDKTKNVDYTVNLDLNSNLGNPSVFGR